MLVNPATTTMEMTSIQQDAYTDLHALNKINQLGRDDQSAALKALSEQFESIFMSLMLKSMRQASVPFEEGGLFNSEDVKFYRDMYDQQLTLNLSNSGGIGLAEAFYNQMQNQFADTQPQRSRHLDTVLSTPAKATSTLGGDQLSSAKSQPLASDITNAPLPSARFENYSGQPEDFVTSIYPFMQQAAKQLGVEPDVLVAQSALETGWGKYIATDGNGFSSNNLFNIKADQRWNGNVVNVSTIEFRHGVAERERASFRQYESIQDSVRDYVDFIRNNPRYDSALKATNSEEYIQSLQESGYATDPEYADKILKLLNSDVFNNATLSIRHAAFRG
ncbi:flagellar assembly peptidoglycan hydrolase FlgJ [Aurantivibrio plasticivorans]